MTDPRPLWRQIYDHVKLLIELGELQEGDPIPTEPRLGEQFECSRGPVRQAINQLEQHGLIEGRSSSTRTVRRTRKFRWDITRHEHPRLRLDDPDSGIDDWAADIVAQGMTPRQLVSVQGMSAPHRVAEWLELPDSTRMVRRRRIRMANNLPVCISDSWFTDEDARRTVTVDGEVIRPVMEERDVVIAGGFVAAMGIRQVQYINRFSAPPPTDELEALLSLPSTGGTILHWVRVGIDDTGRRVRAIEHHCAGNRVVVEFTQWLYEGA